MTADTRSSWVVGGRLAAGCSFLFSSFQSSSLFLLVSLSSSDPPLILRFLTLTRVSPHLPFRLCRDDMVYCNSDIVDLFFVRYYYCLAAVILAAYLVAIESPNNRIRYVEWTKRRLIKSFSGRWRASMRAEEDENVERWWWGRMC